jgi:CRP-like cAMP-binding protein
MPPIPDSAVFQERLATLPVKTYEAGETVFAAGSRTGRLLILRKGSVVIVKDGVEIAKVAEPGAVFGELSVLLDKPHTRTFGLSKPRSFSLPMRRPFSHKTRLQPCMLLRSSRGG